METTSLSSKGQIVLPLKVRAARGWKPGTAFEVHNTPEGVLLKPLQAAPIFAPTQIDEVFGMAPSPKRSVSLPDMDASVLAEAARRR
jgi:AbrB family looped-hinge helix DNA binding protein